MAALSDRYLYPIVNGLDQSAVAAWIKGSVWLVPWAGALHLLALGLLGGAILMVDMRVLGGGLRAHGPAAINRTARPLSLLALALMVASGLTMAFGELLKLYDSPPYWLKMASLAAAIGFTFGVRNRLIAADGRLSLAGGFLAIATIGLWAGMFVLLSDLAARLAMAILLAALVALAAWGGRCERAAGQTPCGGLLKAASIVSMAMWLTTATAGRWIAFY